MAVLRFKYKPRWMLLIGCIVMLTAMSIAILYIAQQPVRSHSLGRLLVGLNLDAKLIFNIVGWTGVAFCAAGAFALYVMQTHGDRYVEIGPEGVRSPVSGFSAKIVEISFTEIQQVSLQTVQSTRTISIQHTKGMLQLSNTMFPDKGAFDEFLAILNTKTSAS